MGYVFFFEIYVSKECYIASMTLYPPSEGCSNSDCIHRGRALKKAEFREVVVYTVALGACRAYSTHLFCPSKIFSAHISTKAN